MTVGPSLGADSIREGVRAAVIGMVAVMIFMLFYYHAAGINADLALLLNLVILLGFLGFSGATLTLPGIAGVILTVGMGVDSNVLIFERIREELRHGKTPSSAVDQGFAHAWTTIFDTHVTTIVSAIILFLFGTGPVKGFAVTLSFGLAANLFTAVFVSRVIFEADSESPSARRSVEHLKGVFTTEARRTRSKNRNLEFAMTMLMTDPLNRTAGGIQLLEADLTGEIIGAAVEVHRELGPGLLESAYQACMCRELALRQVPFRSQVELPVDYKGCKLDCGYRIDLLVNDRVLVELKSVERLSTIHESQLLTYLRLSRTRVGLLINFNVPILRKGILRRVL